MSFSARHKLFAPAVLFGTLAVSCVAFPGMAAATDASSGGGWFVPKSSQPPAPVHAKPAAQPVHRHRSVPVPVPVSPPPSAPAAAQNDRPPVLPLPPVPEPAALAKGKVPSSPVIGVISVPEIMRQSIAAQQAEKILGARRDKLARDAQKEQSAWRDEQQKLQAQARKLTAAQIQARERALQARVMKARRVFQKRNRIIQEAAQVAFGQIERTLIKIIKQVAASHNMNLVIHREQVALAAGELDITMQALNQLNSTLSNVFIPAEDVDPEELAKSGTMPTTASPDGAKKVAPAVAPSKPAQDKKGK